MQKGFGLVLLLVSIAIIALLAVWQLTGSQGLTKSTSRAGLVETQKDAVKDIGNINDQLKQQYPTDLIAP